MEVRRRRRLCNYCGRKLDIYDSNQSFRIHTRIGYGSAYDGNVADMRLCCGCFDKIVGECAVTPLVKPDARLSKVP